MKKIIIGILASFLLIGNSSADIWIPGQDCANYDKSCYEKCMKDKNGRNDEGLCKEKCCTKRKKYCNDPVAEVECRKNSALPVYCHRDTKYDCTDYEQDIKISPSLFDGKIFKISFSLIFIIFSLIVYKIATKEQIKNGK